MFVTSGLEGLCKASTTGKGNITVGTQPLSRVTRSLTKLFDSLRHSFKTKRLEECLKVLAAEASDAEHSGMVSCKKLSEVCRHKAVHT